MICNSYVRMLAIYSVEWFNGISNLKQRFNQEEIGL